MMGVLVQRQLQLQLQTGLRLWLLAAVVGLSGCAGLGKPEPASQAGKAGLSSTLEARRVALEAANQSTGISVLTTANGQLQINLPSDFSFDSDGASVKPGMRPLLDHLAADLAGPTMANLLIQVIGFTDSEGSESANVTLSLARANNVRKYLEGKGIAAARLSAEGRGEEAPLAGNDKRYGRALNRRVEIYLREPG